MDILIILGKVYIFILILLYIAYIIRHLIFTFNRAISEQRLTYIDVQDSELPYVSVLIPMHNEEKVASHILDALVNQAYPLDKIEIIPINDHSTDRTGEILEEYAKRYPHVKPLHRIGNEPLGKPQSLNDALKIAKGEIIIVYDADYLPSRGQIRDLVINFIDPEVGAAMGRVIPYNVDVNVLTRLLDLERSAGYQVDQQARYNLNLIPQFGGTVGAFRKDLILKTGGFDESILAEDTELTFRLYTEGYKVIYVNRAECYEEVPENWEARARQIRRWSCGHNQVLFKYFFKVIFSKHLNFWQKIDGVLLLMVYMLPFLTLVGYIDSLFLFFAGEMDLFTINFLILVFIVYNAFGNFAPFFEIGMAGFLDGMTYRLRLLPIFYFVFLYNLWYTTLGFFDALSTLIFRKEVGWQKTERFRR